MSKYTTVRPPIKVGLCGSVCWLLRWSNDRSLRADNLLTLIRLCSHVVPVWVLLLLFALLSPSCCWNWRNTSLTQHILQLSPHTLFSHIFTDTLLVFADKKRIRSTPGPPHSPLGKGGLGPSYTGYGRGTIMNALSAPQHGAPADKHSGLQSRRKSLGFVWGFGEQEEIQNIAACWRSREKVSQITTRDRKAKQQIQSGGIFTC